MTQIALDKTCDVDFLSETLHLTPRRVQQLANEGVIHKSERGRYDLIKSVQGYIQYLNDLVPNKSSSDAGQQFARTDLVSEQVKLTKHKAELARMEEEKEKGLLVYAEDQRRRGATAMLAVRNSLQNIAPRISQELAIDTDANNIYRRLEAEIGTALGEAYKIIAEHIADEDGVDVTV